MIKLKLTAFLSFLLVSFILTSCEEDQNNPVTVSNSVAMNGANVVPANASAATGNIQATYDFKTRLLNYKLTWTGLSGTVTAIHVHGLADAGFIALPAPLGPHANGIIQTVPAGFPTTASGTYSGFLLIDNLVIKEADLLAGKYYIDIHTSVAPFTTTGQIRGQLTFPN